VACTCSSSRADRVGDGAGALLGEPLERADPAEVRARTGFAIGGVAPIGHHEPPLVAMDPLLLTFEVVWAAAGTPRHVFSIDPGALHRLTAARPRRIHG
jgi:prolyl-tRNA editing enzyme YbaK/EbsC (Cys-tRNA(Pro) deacylase)